MKKSFLILSLLWVLILSGCGWSGDIIEYNDNFVDIVKECTDSTQALFNTFQADKSTIDSIGESLQSAIDICESSKAKALKLWDYDKDTSLKDAVVNLLSMEVDYLQKFQATDRYRNVDNLTDEDKSAYNWIVNELNDSQSALNQQFINLQDVQEAFAAKHWLKLE